jgi:hypothetical protein
MVNCIHQLDSCLCQAKAHCSLRIDEIAAERIAMNTNGGPCARNGVGGVVVTTRTQAPLGALGLALPLFRVERASGAASVWTGFHVVHPFMIEL